MKVWAAQTLGLSRIATLPKKRAAIIYQVLVPTMVSWFMLFELNFVMQSLESHDAEGSPNGQGCPQRFCVVKYNECEGVRSLLSKTQRSMKFSPLDFSFRGRIRVQCNGRCGVLLRILACLHTYHAHTDHTASHRHRVTLRKKQDSLRFTFLVLYRWLWFPRTTGTNGSRLWFSHYRGWNTDGSGKTRFAAVRFTVPG